MNVHPYALALALMASGCFSSHELEPRSSDIARDASPPRPRVDAGTPDFPDADVTLPPVMGGDPIPDDEPDVTAGERPSDDPAADDWREPPSESGACCEVGAIVPLDDIDRQASAPVVAWNGSGWGVTFADLPAPPEWSGDPIRTVFRRIDPMGHPSGPLSVLDGFDVRPTDLAWGNNRYGLITHGAMEGGPALLAILDSAGVPREVTAVLESNGAATIERYPLVHGWAVVTYFVEGWGGYSRLLLFDDSLNRLSPERDLGYTLGADRRSLAIVPSKSRLSTVQATEVGIVHRVFVGDGLEEDPSARVETWPGTFLEMTGRDETTEQIARAVSAVGLRDSVVVAFTNRTHLAAYVVDPFGEVPPTEPVPLAATPAHLNPGMGADDVTGTVGICFPDGDGPIGGPSMVDADEIRFAVVGLDGRPVGEPITIVSDLRYVAACDVAAAGPGEWFVTWWDAAREERRHSISGARITLRSR
jgi:hypothetical protein